MKTLQVFSYFSLKSFKNIFSHILMFRSVSHIPDCALICPKSECPKASRLSSTSSSFWGSTGTSDSLAINKCHFLPLITTVIINSNYDELPASHNCWAPGLSLTIVLTDICNLQLSVEPSAPVEHLKDIVPMGRKGRMWTGQTEQHRTGQCCEVEIKLLFQEGEQCLGSTVVLYRPLQD